MMGAIKTTARRFYCWLDHGHPAKAVACGAAAILALFALLAYFVIIPGDHAFDEQCRAKGGEPMSLTHDRLCLKPGAVVHFNGA